MNKNEDTLVIKKQNETEVLKLFNLFYLVKEDGLTVISQILKKKEHDF